MVMRIGNCLSSKTKSFHGMRWERKRLNEDQAFYLFFKHHSTNTRGNSEFPWLKVSRQSYPSDDRLWRETLSHGNSEFPRVLVLCASSASWALWWDINCHFTFFLDIICIFLKTWKLSQITMPERKREKERWREEGEERIGEIDR